MPEDARMQLITFQNRTLSLREWSRATGIHVSTLYSRVKAGYPVEELLDPDSGRRRQLAALSRGRASFEKPLTCGDETHTMAEWSRRTGIQKRTIRERLKAGWAVEKALGVEQSAEASNATS